MSADQYGDMSMLDLFRLEVESQTQAMTDALLALEADPRSVQHLETCMRGAHSLKGAARIINLDTGVKIAHAMEECLVNAQRAKLTVAKPHIDVLFRGLDLLRKIADTADTDGQQWAASNAQECEEFLRVLERTCTDGVEAHEPQQTAALPAPTDSPAEAGIESNDRVLRLSAESLNQLLGLAGESLVASRWLKPFGDAMLRIKRKQDEVGRDLERLSNLLSQGAAQEEIVAILQQTRERHASCRQWQGERLAELEAFARRENELSQRLYDQALASRMRPFSDGVVAFPRMVRDLAKELGKAVRLVVSGHAVRVDRDILEKLDAPLTHLLRNAVDHGIESVEERRAAAKPAEALIRLDAMHAAGMLHISVQDDGRGIDIARLREKIIERQLTNAETAAKLSEAELLEFLFLPGFTMKDSVTELSGRGVGLDIVQHMLKQVRGTVRVESEPGKGTCFKLQLPLTMSVMRALLADVGGEVYAFPLTHLVRVLKIHVGEIEQVEGHQHFKWGERQVGLVTAHQILQSDAPRLADELSVVMVGAPAHPYGIVVDRLLGEQELVVQTLDPRLGKIKDIAAGAIMEDGTPVLIVDVDDLIRSVDKLVAAGPLLRAGHDHAGVEDQKRKRVLVVDDSLTVRELERKLLANRGYQVDVAVDGMDGWNAVRTGHFDLVITDVDMPRMDGIELVSLIKQNPQLKAVPVMIVSYKDREEDRLRGLDAGADYYLTKGGFHDERLLEAVVDLIGEANQ